MARSANQNTRRDTVGANAHLGNSQRMNTAFCNRLNLQSWIPTELRPTLTGMFVGFGQVRVQSQYKV